MTDFWLASRTNDPTQPWGDDPPPAPAKASARERARVEDAWATWSHFRPFYLRTGDLVEAEIDLKGSAWQGSARIKPRRPESDAYWDALQACIKGWRRDTRSIRLRMRLGLDV